MWVICWEAGGKGGGDGEMLHLSLLARADLLARVVKVSSEVRADKNYWLVGCKYVRGVEPKDAESRVCRIVPRTTGATRCHGVARHVHHGGAAGLDRACIKAGRILTRRPHG